MAKNGIIFKKEFKPKCRKLRLLPWGQEAGFLTAPRGDGARKDIPRRDIRLDRDYYEEYVLKEKLEGLQDTDLIEIGEETDG